MAQWYRVCLESSNLQTLRSLTSSPSVTWSTPSHTLINLCHTPLGQPLPHQVNFCYAPFIFPEILQVRINGRKKNPCIYFIIFVLFCFVEKALGNADSSGTCYVGSNSQISSFFCLHSSGTKGIY